ncbi:MAG: autotransporter domain-containing protein, partial [Zoogloeaceae bacterium]|nr:autotransporter domain-containing protein [Zoogloeaceae bacterium]
DLALDEDRGERAWVPFGGVDAARLRVRTDSRIELAATNLVVGFASRKRGDSGVLLLGAFLEAGRADYDTRNHFSDLESIHGDGKLRAVGGGLMARHTWGNQFRVEASLRAGRLKNEFSARNYADENGVHASYKFRDRYLAAHLGVGKSWQLSEKNSVDVLLRYYWNRQEGGNVTLSSDERMRFYDDDSQRLRIGARFTHHWKENRFWYVGAAVERELDSKVNASAHDFAFDAHDFKGATGIGEIGLILRSRKNDKNSPFSLEAGLQGYAGKIRGISGGIRLGWEF